ncbi:hypothetical protein [Streptomyces sp. NPDC058751]
MVDQPESSPALARHPPIRPAETIEAHRTFLAHRRVTRLSMTEGNVML